MWSPLSADRQIANSSFEVVVTTIQPPTESLRRWVKALKGLGVRPIIIGDYGTPPFRLHGAEFLSLSTQRRMPFNLAKILPERCYSRKNLGFLTAMYRGASAIFETDDDNQPLPNWAPRSTTVPAQSIYSGLWSNVYSLFTDERIWPRGFPLRRILGSERIFLDKELTVGNSPIQQCLVNGAADVDAIWRLVLDRDIRFSQGESVRVGPGSWCPFNSQATWWFPDAYPLMYLPSYCSIRMCDIWRSFVAQRCLWTLGHSVVFHAPDIEQLRNAHDLMADFRSEIPGYCHAEEIVQVLTDLDLSEDPASCSRNLRRCYGALIETGHYPPEELNLVDAWLTDLEAIGVT